MFLKYKVNIKLLNDYRFGEDGNLYKLPFTDKSGNHREVRLIKPQGNKWKIGNEWISRNQLQAIKDKGLVSIDTDPYEIKESDCPF